MKGKRCLIVGGTSGIGLAVARRFHENAAHVVVSGLGDVDGRVGTALPAGMAGVRSISCDARDADSLGNLFSACRRHLGGLDVLVHSVGASARRRGDGPLHECSEAGWDWAMETNLKTAFLTNREAIRGFRESGEPGAILNIASMLAWQPRPRCFDTVAYAAAKAGVISLSLTAAARYAESGVRVNVLAPGLIDTPMSARAMADPAIQLYLRSKQPLGPGPGSPDDCAMAAVFLCSDEARFLTGVVLPVDGGWALTDGQYVATPAEEQRDRT